MPSRRIRTRACGLRPAPLRLPALFSPYFFDQTPFRRRKGKHVRPAYTQCAAPWQSLPCKCPRQYTRARLRPDRPDAPWSTSGTSTSARISLSRSTSQLRHAMVNAMRRANRHSQRRYARAAHKIQRFLRVGVAAPRHRHGCPLCRPPCPSSPSTGTPHALPAPCHQTDGGYVFFIGQKRSVHH